MELTCTQSKRTSAGLLTRALASTTGLRNTWPSRVSLLLVVLAGTGCRSERAEQELQAQATATAVVELAWASFAELPQAENPQANPSQTGPIEPAKATSVAEQVKPPDTALAPKSLAVLTPALQKPVLQTPVSSPWHRQTILVCQGNYCQVVSGRLHAGGDWFYSDSGNYYRKSQGLWRLRSPPSRTKAKS